MGGPGAPGPYRPLASPSAWAPPPPRSSTGPSRRGGGWLGPLVVLVVLGGLIAIAVVAVRNGEQDDAAERRTGSDLTTETAPPTTTIPRVTQTELLSAYCNAPGAKWPEVPPHVPGEPDRTQVRFLGGGVDSASDTKDRRVSDGSGEGIGGSTVISPQTDGAFTDDPSVLPRTRTVTCVTHIATDPTGETCEYNTGPFEISTSYRAMNVARNRYAITVYELHSGGILHKGEIQTRASGCPPFAQSQDPSGMVAYGLTEQDILAWLNSHFVAGKPA